jgi:hypothetical protein
MARLLAAEAALVVLFTLTLLSWFAGWPHVPAAVPFALCVLVAFVRFLVLARPRLTRPSLETIACLIAAVLFRLPALRYPWGWVNKDGFYGAYVTLRILDGTRPVLPFTEGANYQGTLKSHLAALLSTLTGITDLSWLMLAASLLLHLVFIAATMALARRIGGRGAALGAGLYLALSPRFLTVFTLNCVGQYADVLALGGLALAVLARVLDGERTGAPARGAYFAIGLLLGAAFWQQPVAISYIVTTAAMLLLRRATWRDPWVLLVLVGGAVGALPSLVWNVQNHWGTGAMMGGDPDALREQLEGLPRLLRRTFTIAYPILAGLSPELPWAGAAIVRGVAIVILPLALVGYLAIRRRDGATLWRGTPSPSLLPVLLFLVCTGIFLSFASGRVYWRPRYLLPVLAATAVQLGVVLAALALRSRVASAGLGALVLVLNVSGSWPRLAESAGLADYYERLVHSLEEKKIQTGYTTFSISAPVTMFTAERIVLSPRLDALPSYEPVRHARLVDTRGADAFLLPREDEWQAFASRLDALGVTYRLDPEPVPTFWALSRRVDLAEVADFRTGPIIPERE